MLLENKTAVIYGGGGSIGGACGYNAAGAIAADLGIDAWWGAEASSYAAIVLYRPFTTDATVARDGSRDVLTLTIRDQRWPPPPGLRSGRYNALTPDHGKLMHLFLVRDDLQAFAHLHPVPESRVGERFQTGVPPLPAHFPLRNRLISGLSRVVVVIEASDKSGSLITASCALEQGRDVMAVPGNVLSGRNKGGHALIRDGARIVETADDILAELGVAAPVPAGPAQDGSGCGTAASVDPLLTQMEPGEAYDLDALVKLSGLAPGRLLPRLMHLELGGSVHRVEGGRFIRG